MTNPLDELEGYKIVLFHDPNDQIQKMPILNLKTNILCVSVLREIFGKFYEKKILQLIFEVPYRNDYTDLMTNITQ